MKLTITTFDGEERTVRIRRCHTVEFYGCVECFRVAENVLELRSLDGRRYKVLGGICETHRRDVKTGEVNEAIVAKHAEWAIEDGIDGSASEYRRR
jgi:hypothetical protein